jgi:hypothetical protein
VVIEPPRDARRGRVLEIDNRVFVACEFALIKESPGAMHQPVVVVNGIARDALAVKVREQRGAASSVKTFVMVEDTNLQNL